MTKVPENGQRCVQLLYGKGPRKTYKKRAINKKTNAESTAHRGWWRGARCGSPPCVPALHCVML